MLIKKVLLPLLLSTFFLGSCERPEPIPSALRAYVDYIRYDTNEKAFYTHYHLNFKTQNLKFKWIAGNSVCFEFSPKNVKFDGIDSFRSALDAFNITLPARLFCVVEATTLGGDIIRDTSAPIHIGYLENTPFGNAPGLLAFWPLVHNFEDHTLNQHHLIAVGNPIFRTFPNTFFDGTYFSNDAYLYIPHKENLNPREISISTLLYLDDLIDPADLHTVVSKREFAGWGNSFDFKVSKRVESGFKVSVSWTYNGIDSYLESEQNFSFKQPINIVYVHDKKKIQIWVNGEKTDERTSPGLLNNENNLPICIGTRPGVRHSFTGYLRDVGIWNRGLTEAEIKAISAIYR